MIDLQSAAWMIGFATVVAALSVPASLFNRKWLSGLCIGASVLICDYGFGLAGFGL